MAGGRDNKTEKPTQRRLRKAREKGQIARSKEVSSAGVLFGGILLLMFLGQNILQTLEYEMKHLLVSRVPSDLSMTYLSGMTNGAAVRVAIAVLPVLLATLIFSITANAIQGGLVFSTKSLGIHFEKLNPKKGLERIFSKNGLVELIKSLLTLIVIGFITYQVIKANLPVFPRLVLMDVRKLFYWTTFISFEVLIRIAVLLMVLALGDYLFQKYRFTEQLKMSKQEIKEEFKETEGDPITKGRIRRIQREMARRRMMADVPTADVIITNPTHYSVALSYQVETMDAPRVVAKGVGFLALKIREVAQDHDIPLVENKPLAQTLYKTVEIGESIPSSLYKAVAEILAYVYRAKNALSR
jgi:flagellar biosynthetic protein FlhB